MTWYRESNDRITTSKHIIALSDANGAKHTLRFGSVRDVDFGVYTCKAENILGLAQASIEISGILHLNNNRKFQEGGTRFCHSIESCINLIEQHGHGFYSTLILPHQHIYLYKKERKGKAIKQQQQQQKGGKKREKEIPPPTRFL